MSDDTRASHADATSDASSGDESASPFPRLRVVADLDSVAVADSMDRLAVRYFGRRADDALRICLSPDDTPPPAA